MSGSITMEDPHKTGLQEKQPLNKSYEPSGLQVKLQKQRDKIRSSAMKSAPITRAPKKTSLISASRLHIPKGGYQKLDSSPLVTLQSDSEDELFLSYERGSSSRLVNNEMSRQLQKDGFQLDEVPDDEDLDLIPPSDFRKPDHCNCCGVYETVCVIS